MTDIIHLDFVNANDQNTAMYSRRKIDVTNIDVDKIAAGTAHAYLKNQLKDFMCKTLNLN